MGFNSGFKGLKIIQVPCNKTSRHVCVCVCVCVYIYIYSNSCVVFRYNAIQTCMYSVVSNSGAGHGIYVVTYNAIQTCLYSVVSNSSAGHGIYMVTLLTLGILNLI